MANDDRKVGRARAKSFDRNRGPMVGFASFGFFFGGVALAAVGVAVNLRPSLHPRLGQVEWVLGRLGLGAEHLLLVGVSLAAAGVVLSALRSFARLLGVDRETAESIDDLARATTNQADCIEALEAHITVLRQETAEVHAVLREQAALLKRREENDPAFRIAASLDQVGARLDRGIIDARDMLLDELHQSASRGQTSDDGPMIDGLDRVEGTLRELATLTLHFQRALEAAVQPMEPAARVEPDESAPVTPSWSDLEPRVSIERYTHPQDAERSHRDTLSWGAVEPANDDDGRDEDDGRVERDERDERYQRDEPAHHDAREVAAASAQQPDEAPELPTLRFAAPPQFVADEVDDSAPTELSIEVELDRAFVDASEDEVPPPLPAPRPEGLDLLARLDSAHPLEMTSRSDSPPLFPDLDGDDRS